MLENLEKKEIKKVVLQALEDFADLSVGIETPGAREAIAFRIASDILELQEFVVSPDSVLKDLRK